MIHQGGKAVEVEISGEVGATDGGRGFSGSIFLECGGPILGSLGRTRVSGYLDSIQLHDILFYGSRPATRQGLVDNTLIDHLFDLLRAGAEPRAWTIDDARLTAVYLFTGLHGVVDDAHSKEKRVNRGRLADRMERLCFRSVGLPLG
jgi:hypothetical protein